ncbi:AMP-binding protein [Vibrio bivalvicida]|uniref:AMP-fatty acid ligase n=1 Tax=Vibrio bivalvicida TaxID=1276888 RepID=A0A177Y322_9VIBR|nr:AMP-binding protein [Vibrio bivalvicida]OAJ94885.1 AMP-fatty acid ligase [Vibrio bivalvicida]
MNLATAEFSSLANVMNTKHQDTDPVAFAHNSVRTWHEFQGDVAQLSQQLITHPAQRVALCFSSSYLFAVGFFASCYANKVIILPGNYQTQAVAELNDHFDLLIHDDQVIVADGVPTLEVGSADFDTYLKPCFKTLQLEQISITLFTSGSSGKAKAINKTLKQLDTEIAILESLWGEQLANARIESTVSHQHIYGLLFRVLWPLCAGRAFAKNNLEFPEQVIHHADKNTVLISSPALLKRLTEEHRGSALRCVFSSGGPLPSSAANHSKALFAHLPIEVFGSTETGGIAYRQQHASITPWQLFPSVEAELNSESCLRLRAEHIAGEEWYQTADECHFHDKVTFDLKGRTDRVVKIEEKRVSLVEVERRLEQLDWIQESAVIPLQDGNRLTLCAVIVLTDVGQQVIEQLGKGKFWLSLRKNLRDWLEPIAIPRKYRLLDEIPLNSQGKRQVAEIERLFQE